LNFLLRPKILPSAIESPLGLRQVGKSELDVDDLDIRAGSTEPDTWMMSSFSKQRTT